jgi:hypothetical protein
MRHAIVLVVALSVAWWARGADSGISASSIMSEIARDGAAKVLSRLTEGSGAAWDGVVAHIASGQDEWLGVARALRATVDAGTGEALTQALSKALANNPTGVLMMTGKDFPIAQICDVPFIEPTESQVARWKHKVLAALEQVTDTSLSEKARACRAAIASIN